MTLPHSRWLILGGAILASALLLAWVLPAVLRPELPTPRPLPVVPTNPIAEQRWRALLADHGAQDVPPGAPLELWRVIDHISAHNVLIVRVETSRFDEARGIARRLVESVKHDYAEILVYLYRPGTRMMATRIQWTPKGGFVEDDYKTVPAR